MCATSLTQVRGWGRVAGAVSLQVVDRPARVTTTTSIWTFQMLICLMTCSCAPEQRVLRRMAILGTYRLPSGTYRLPRSSTGPHRSLPCRMFCTPSMRAELAVNIIRNFLLQPLFRAQATCTIARRVCSIIALHSFLRESSWNHSRLVMRPWRRNSSVTRHCSYPLQATDSGWPSTHPLYLGRGRSVRIQSRPSPACPALPRPSRSWTF